MKLKQLLTSMLPGNKTAGAVEVSALPLPPADKEAEGLMSKFVKEHKARFPAARKFEEFEAGREIEALPPERKLQVLYAAYGQITGPMTMGKILGAHWALETLTGALLRSVLPHTSEGLAAMLAGWAPAARERDFAMLPLQALLRATARHVKKHGMTPEIAAVTDALRAACESHKKDEKAVRALATLDEIAGRTAPPPPPIRIEGGEAWADAMIADLAEMSAEEQEAWRKLLTYCRTATPSHPTGKWLAGAKEKVEKVGDSFAPMAAKWLPMVDQRRTQPLPYDGGLRWMPDPNELLSDKSVDILKGLAWCCATVDDAPLARALADCAQASFKKIRWEGPRAPRLGNACLDALAAMPNAEAAAQLSRLSTSVKQPTGKKTVTRAIKNLADRTHQTPEDLEELSLPTYDMTTPGVLERSVGRFTARLDLASSSITYTAGGKTRKSAPAELKSDPALKAFQKLARDVGKMFDAQKLRLERLLMSDRSWPLDEWKKRYLNHPLLAPLTGRLIWTFTTPDNHTTTAIPRDGKFLTQEGKPFNPVPSSTVRLWHPVGATPELVLAWRTFLQDRRITQPFKQAHREIYILTDAELQTRTYSNRFAAHIIRQQQFRALCQQRGWKAGLVGSWDPGTDTTPTLELPRHDLRVQFWVDVAAAGTLGDTGVVPYLATDQVRFYRGGNHERPIPLSDVPAPVFSEVMRDVDLFVAVCSVGNDPAWRDAGEAEAFADYWQSYSFGSLSQSAQTRREVLASLLPRLKIADRCTLADRFLVVRGELRTYKIHLGSGNILMEPNDQYLCIVPNRSPAAGDSSLFLPFEGDTMLAIILSKAFLLADDTKITDSTITRQIQAK